jgi:hypothetical protein
MKVVSMTMNAMHVSSRGLELFSSAYPGGNWSIGGNGEAEDMM